MMETMGRTAAEHIEAWARFINDGAYRWPGPVGLSNPGDDIAKVEAEDVESFKLVDSVLGRMGRPENLKEALIHRYWKGDPIEHFHPLPPGTHLPRGITSLGWSVQELVEVKIKLFEKAVIKTLQGL